RLSFRIRLPPRPLPLRNLQRRARQERISSRSVTCFRFFPRSSHVQTESPRHCRNPSRKLRHPNLLLRRPFHRHLFLRLPPFYFPLCRVCEICHCQGLDDFSPHWLDHSYCLHAFAFFVVPIHPANSAAACLSQFCRPASLAWHSQLRQRDFECA